MQYNRIVVYYDNGQIELSGILKAIFSAHLNHVEFRKPFHKSINYLKDGLIKI